MDKMIEFTPDRARRFVIAYNRAKRENIDVFVFETDQYVIGYAYYVIEYLVMNKILNGSFDENKIFTWK